MGYIESNLVRDEHIVYVGRKHVILMLGQIVTEIILIGLTLVAFSVVSLVFKKYNMTQNTLHIIVYGALGLATTVLVVSGVLDYLKWYNDCVVITNRRMMRFEGLFNRHMVESILNKINEMRLYFFARIHHLTKKIRRSENYRFSLMIDTGLGLIH